MPKGTQAHEPTDATRQTVQLHATVGTDQHIIARVLGISKNTLRKHYMDELELATAKANATVGGSLYKKATGYTDKEGTYHPPETAAQIFWMKTRARWSETHRHEHESPDGSMTPKSGLDASKLSTEALAEIMKAADATRSTDD